MSTTEPTPPHESKPTTAPRAEGNKLAGCYLLSRRLTIGQDKEVWLAFDEVLGKDVSLHFAPETVRRDSRAVHELRLDIKRNRQLIHPNILRVYDLVEEPEWVAISMDPFDGESLGQRLERQAGKGSGYQEIQPWVEQLAQTLEESHKINVLHLDVTPSNLFLTTAGKLLVANFGISRTLRDAEARAGGTSAPDAVYRSPQLMEGKPPAVTDDIYSFGVVLFAALTGNPPSREGGSAAALTALGNESLALPENWRTTIAACLSEDPAARPQSAADVAQRLAKEAEKAAPIPVEAPKVETAPPAPAAKTEAAPSKPEPKVDRKRESVMTQKPAIDPVAPAVAATSMAKEPAKEPKTSKPEVPATSPKTPPPPPTDFSTRLYPTESRFPWTWLVAAAAVLIIGAIIYNSRNPEKPDAPPYSIQQPDNAPVPTVTTDPQAPGSTPPAEPVAVVEPEPNKVPAVPPVAEGSGKLIAEKMAALEQAKQAAQAAQKTYAALQEEQQKADSSVSDLQKGIDDKTKAADLMKKEAQDAVAQRNKVEEEVKAAEAAAAEAQKMALEKARLAEESKKAFVEVEKRTLEKMTAPQQAEAEIAALQKALSEKQRVAEEAAKAVALAQAAKERQVAAVTENERQIELLKSADVEAQRQREAAEAQRSKLDQELAEMQRAFKEKMAELESKRKSLENPGATAAPAPSAPTAPPSNATPPPTPTSAAPAQEPIKIASIPSTPAPSVTPPPSVDNVAGGNSLGMKFVRVGDVEFSIWQTRVKDFETFAKAVNLKSISWKGPGFKQGPDHPVVNVTWQEAMAFCKWLTDKEHKEGTLPPQQHYRLPTDLEWSKAVGLNDETGKTPEVRDMGVPDQYPWGKAWPPPPGAGNYTGEETGSDVAIKGYDDGFAWTAPVGSFRPNEFGLYDMGGNVWQWCMDTWNPESKAKVLRGASWYNGALKLSLLSSCRVHAAPDSSTDNYGFRIVRATEAAKTGKK